MADLAKEYGVHPRNIYGFLSRSGQNSGALLELAKLKREQDALLDIYEPYLMRLGFIERTPKGRMATRLAYQHLGLKKYKGSQNLL